ncbi:calponin homology domain-containing protein [Globomyces pollinis-pini]|nr:calponin homology domain-containing protein [Globomyces pollinis-pini]
MSESRTELIAWYNDLSNQSYSKIEQFGTGAAHCLIIDSIYRDLPLQKVKFQAKHEWEYVANFKVLQAAFDKHKIDNFIPVERLIKCKFQDNLEFLQWIKKFWDQYYPGGTYEPRVAGSITTASTKKKPLTKANSDNAVHPETPKVKTASKPLKSAAAAAGPARSNGSARDLSEDYQKIAMDLTSQIGELKITVDQADKEREFYFSKLREIEVYIQSRIESGITTELDTAFKDIQSIMYKTEEGFETPDGEFEA